MSGDKTSWIATDPLLIAGNGGHSGDRSNALLLRKNGNMTIAGNLTENSDRRLKTDIQEIGSVLDELETVDPVRFRFKKGTGHPEDPQIGLIAQEVQKNFPELVSKGSDGYLSLAYPKLTAVLLKGLQEQQSTIEKVKTENEKIQARLSALESKVSDVPAATAGLTSSWLLVFGLGLGLGGAIGLLVRRRADEQS